MCGLIGYSGNNKAAPFILEALKRLEYRGYDSAGIATLSDGELLYKKDTGKIKEVEDKQQLSRLPGNVGIGHVRWATHGEVNQVNAHPQMDNQNTIAVVHNGIVENASELRQRLETEYKFISTTDTEVIPFLLARYFKQTGSMTVAIAKVVNDLRGPFAFLALCKTQQNKFFACAREMPLLLGKGPAGCIAASDIDSFPEEYTQLYAIENGESAMVSSDSIIFTDSEGNQVIKTPETMHHQTSFAINDSTQHYMMHEIREEPWAIEQAIMQDEATLEKAASAIKSAKNVIFTACGTSRHAALMGRYLFSRVGGKLSEVIIGSEFKYFADSITPESVVIAVSQSGETADVLEGVRAARNKGAIIISLVNRTSSQLARLSDLVLPLRCGQENAVAATKSYIAQITILTVLSHYIAKQHGTIAQKLKDIVPLVELAYETNLKKAEQIAKYIAGFNVCYFIARGSNFHIATEAALKMKEVSYVHGEGMPAGELKHGTLALIEKGTPVVVICPDDYTFEDTIRNAEEAKSRGAFIIGVSDLYHPVFDEWLKIPRVEDLLYPFVTIVPLQELAYSTALAKNIDPDRPRNLAKSVTVK
jgi:glucosamine--fructose-6-phosphate aminotransferase (isomerizing)